MVNSRYKLLLDQTFFRENMEYIFKASHLTQEAFADIFDRDRKTIFNLMNGTSCLLGPSVITILRVLNCQIVDLFFTDMQQDNWLAGRDIVYEGGVLSFDDEARLMSKARKRHAPPTMGAAPTSPWMEREKELEAQLADRQMKVNELLAINKFLYEKNSLLSKEVDEMEKEIERLKNELDG